MSVSGVVLNTVEIATELTRMKANKHCFAYYDVDDIAQEIWLAVNKSAGRFDPSRVRKKPLQFFNVATENALKNLKRDNQVADNVNIAGQPIIKEDASFEEDVKARELYNHIKSKLPTQLHKPFDLMIYNGAEGVSQYIKTKIRTLVLEILQDETELDL